MRFSPTRLKTWQDCQLQAKFTYIDKIPGVGGSAAAWGNCLHHALELFNKGLVDVEGAIEAFEEAWADPTTIDVGPFVWGPYDDYQKMRVEGVAILRDYVGRLRWTDRNVLFAEHRFCVPFGKHQLTGVVDLGEIGESGGRVRSSKKAREPVLKLVDYKSGRNSYKPYVSNLKLDIQFTAYAYASLQPEFWMGWTTADEKTGEVEVWEPVHELGKKMYETYLEYPRRPVWCQLRQGGKETDCGERTDVDYMRLYRLCNAVEEAIEKEAFTPHISGDTCGLCDYAGTICPMEVPTRAEMGTEYEEDPDRWL